jgi:serine/threonine protein kinase
VHGLEDIDALFTKLSINSLVESIYYLHQKSIVHLNIRPACFYHEWGDVTTWKIGHFVSSRVVGDHIDWEVLTPSRYSSPELVARWGELFLPVQKSMDMWSLGCVIFELATTRSLFSGQDELNQCISSPAWSVPLDDIASPDIRRVLQGLLCIDPNHRMDIDTVRNIMSIRESKLFSGSLSSATANPFAVENASGVANAAVADDVADADEVADEVADVADVADVANVANVADVAKVAGVAVQEHENRPSTSAEKRASFSIEEVE